MAKVSFVRGTDAQIEQLELTEGQVVVSESGKMYVDTDTDRIPISPKEETITAVYDTTVATMVHSVDDYVYVNNYLYRVTSAIAIGDTIAVGTNVELANDIEADTPIYITGLPDSSGGGVQAEDVGYDNTNSGLTADDVQDAIDELGSDLKNVRDNLEGCTTEFNNDGSITETYSDRIKTTEFNNDGSITETITKNGVVIAIKTTTFNQDGSITEEVE